MSHTPGKWHIMDGGFGKSKPGNPNMIQIYATNDDLEMICQVWKDVILHDRSQDYKANARLISVAPDMLKIITNLAEGKIEDAIEESKKILEHLELKRDE